MIRTFLTAAAAACLLAGPGRAANPVVELDTSMGKVRVELFEDKSPATVKNFLQYVDDKHYDNTIFHRVIDGFMVQGGGFQTGLAQVTNPGQLRAKEKKTREPVKNEAGNGLKNEKYTLAMARTNDPDSATAQFFINVKDNDFLNRSGQSAGYAVFGKVVAGAEVVDKIKGVRTTELFPGFGDVPVEDVVIKSARRVEK